MAKKHLTRINQIINQLEKIQIEVQSLCDEFHRKYEKLSDARQESDYGQNLEDIADSLDAALGDGIEGAIEELRNAAMFLGDMPVYIQSRRILNQPAQPVEHEINIEVDKKLLWGGLAAFLALKRK